METMNSTKVAEQHTLLAKLTMAFLGMQMLVAWTAIVAVVVGG